MPKPFIDLPLTALPSSHGVFDCTAAGTVRGDVLCLPLYYPRAKGQISCFEVALIDRVPAAPVRLCFDFVRRGYVLQKQVHSEGEALDVWEEAAFVACESPGTTAPEESRYDWLELHEEIACPD